MKPALVILAAGESSRLGQPKALVDLEGATALERLLDAGASFDDVPPLVVVGAHAREIRARLPSGCEFVDNVDWRSGRTGSAACAVALRPNRSLCLAPVDVPLVSRAVFDALLARWLENGKPARGWLAPRHAGRFGHPLVLGQELARELSEQEKDAPLRLLRAHAEPWLALDVDDPSVLDDLDTPSDLERLRRRLRES